ncbi:hypothetical protein [Caniella muris]|uniref:hypothetical protein n=1 Tax=Caniella muris TaxID=2941502 RepID=UPI00203D0295|nr:hypothetical protein [Caniella muris]
MATPMKPKAEPVVLAVKLKNAMKRVRPDIEAVDVKNILFHEQRVGCSGYFTDGERWVFVDTDILPMLGEQPRALPKALYRICEGPGDTTGGQNYFCLRNADVICRAVGDLLDRERRRAEG